MTEVTTHTYDHANRRIYTDNNGVSFTQYGYDGNNNLTSTLRYDRPYSELAGAEDPQHQVTYQVYDAADTERFTVNALGYVSETVYDAAGHTLRSIQHGQAITLSDAHHAAFTVGDTLLMGSVSPMSEMLWPCMRPVPATGQ